MVEASYNPRKNHNSSKATVYLGCKGLFRKFLLQLKSAFKRYVIDICKNTQEIKYIGDTKGGRREGRGKLFYRNGVVYEGSFKDHMRHGRGCLLMNGISIYEGEWREDQLEGEGYIKSMRFMSGGCPSVFNESSYCGNLSNGRFHGIGTIFLNSKEKVVTKFNCGQPVGELTYYNLNEIQFGVWPQ